MGMVARVGGGGAAHAGTHTQHDATRTAERSVRGSLETRRSSVHSHPLFRAAATHRCIATIRARHGGVGRGAVVGMAVAGRRQGAWAVRESATDSLCDDDTNGGRCMLRHGTHEREGSDEWPAEGRAKSETAARKGVCACARVGSGKKEREGKKDENEIQVRWG